MKPQLIQHLQSDIDLPSAAVHHKDVRKSGETAEFLVDQAPVQFPELVHSVAEAPCEHLFHAGVVIGARHCFDPEFAVIAALRSPLLIDNHGSHVGESADVGNIEGLHAVCLLKPEQLLDLPNSADSPSLFSLEPLTVLVKDKSRVGVGEFDQFLFLSLYRHTQDHFAALDGSQPLFEQFPVLQFAGQKDLPGDRRSSPVELFDKLGQDIRFLPSCHVRHIEVLAADQLAVPQKESLHNSVGIGAGIVHRDTQDIPVLPEILRHLLLLGDLLHIV